MGVMKVSQTSFELKHTIFYRLFWIMIYLATFPALLLTLYAEELFGFQMNEYVGSIYIIIVSMFIYLSTAQLFLSANLEFESKDGRIIFKIKSFMRKGSYEFQIDEIDKLQLKVVKFVPMKKYRLLLLMKSGSALSFSRLFSFSEAEALKNWIDNKQFQMKSEPEA